MKGESSQGLCVLGTSLVMVCWMRREGTRDGNMYCNSPGKSQREAEFGSRPWTWGRFHRLNDVTQSSRLNKKKPRP